MTTPQDRPAGTETKSAAPGMHSTTLETLTDAIDSNTLRRTFGCFPTGVVAVCAEVEGTAVGLVVSSFTSVSLDPPLVSICMMTSSRRWSLLRHATRIGISVMGSTQESECKQLASSTEQGVDDLGLVTTDGGAVLLTDSIAWLDCSLFEEVDAGDHTIALLKIEALHAAPSDAPLVFHNSTFCQLARE